jgi:hypothetical protein
MQWSEATLRAANAFLDLLPESYRRLSQGGRKRTISRTDPSILSPFEAIRSAEIMPMLAEQASLELLDQHWMGSMLPLILTGIAQNFAADDSFSNGYVDLVWEAEQLLHREGLVPGNFVIAVYRKESGP